MDQLGVELGFRGERPGDVEGDRDGVVPPTLTVPPADSSDGPGERVRRVDEVPGALPMSQPSGGASGVGLCGMSNSGIVKGVEGAGTAKGVDGVLSAKSDHETDGRRWRGDRGDPVR